MHVTRMLLAAGSMYAHSTLSRFLLRRCSDKVFRFIITSTQGRPQIEAFGVEWRDFALNGENTRQMGRQFNCRLFLLEGNSVGTAGDIVQDALNEDDADVNVAGDVWEELVEEIVGRVGGVAGNDANDGGGGVAAKAGPALVGGEGADRVVEERGVVRHGAAIVVSADDGARDGIDDALRQLCVGHAEVAGILMGDGRNRKSAEELTGGVLQEADADGLAEALQTGAVRGVRIRTDGDGGDADDGAEVGGIGEVVEGEVALLLPGHGNDHLGGEKT